MTWFSQFMIYVLIWFVVLFAILPWGVRPAAKPEAGHDPGAPANPNLGLKVLATSIVSGIIWFAYFFVTEILGYSLLMLSRGAA